MLTERVGDLRAPVDLPERRERRLIERQRFFRPGYARQGRGQVLLREGDLRRVGDFFRQLQRLAIQVDGPIVLPEIEVDVGGVAEHLRLAAPIVRLAPCGERLPVEVESPVELAERAVDDAEKREDLRHRRTVARATRDRERAFEHLGCLGVAPLRAVRRPDVRQDQSFFNRGVRKAARLEREAVLFQGLVVTPQAVVGLAETAERQRLARRRRRAS